MNAAARIAQSRLIHYRNAAGYSQRELAKASGISVGTISKIECADGVCSEDTYDALDEALQVKLCDFTFSIFPTNKDPVSILRYAPDPRKSVQAFIHSAYTPPHRSSKGRKNLLLDVTFMYSNALPFVGYPLMLYKHIDDRRSIERGSGGYFTPNRYYADVQVSPFKAEGDDGAVVYMDTWIHRLDQHEILLSYKCTEDISTYRLLRRLSDIEYGNAVSTGVVSGGTAATRKEAKALKKKVAALRRS